jgi:hypothetical protein
MAEHLPCLSESVFVGVVTCGSWLSSAGAFRGVGRCIDSHSLQIRRELALQQCSAAEQARELLVSFSIISQQGPIPSGSIAPALGKCLKFCNRFRSTIGAQDQ